jgi:hypothetical protein
MNNLRESFLPCLAKILALEEEDAVVISAEWPMSSFRDLYGPNGGRKFSASIRKEIKAALWSLLIIAYCMTMHDSSGCTGRYKNGGLSWIDRAITEAKHRNHW